MAILVLEHHPLETASRLGQILTEHGHRLHVVELYEGDALPPDLDDIDGLLSLGGPMNVGDTDKHPWIEPELALLKAASDAGLPVVGICLGAQLIAKALGGEVETMDSLEAGFHPVQLAFPGTIDPIHAGIPWRTMQWHLHGQQVTQLPPGATPLSGSQACRNQAFKLGMRTYGFQYHFEWTRDKIIQTLDHDAKWLGDHGIDPQALKDKLDEHYDLFRHLGDRLSTNLASLLYPIDKRLHARMGGSIADFQASKS